MPSKASGKPKTPKKKERSLKSLQTALKAILYPLIKKRDGNICTSCKKRGLKGRNWNAGHFYSDTECSLVYRFDERNLNSQCSYCNKYLHGNYPKYRKAMLSKYGESVVDEIETYYKTPLPKGVKPRDYLLAKIAYYKMIKALPKIPAF